MRVLIVPDKFRGTLTAPQAAEAIAKGWREVHPDDEIEQLPMADGGDGFGEVLGQLLKAERRTCETKDSAGWPRVAEWWLEPVTGTAIIETAQIIGLALLLERRAVAEEQQYHPFHLDTYGIGAVFRQAERAGARRVYVGIGGSSTNDGGFGLARALGWHFWDADGIEIKTWIRLNQLVRVEALPQPLAFDELIIAVDVDNLLLGEHGASRIYGPQKGLLKDEDFTTAEACLGRLTKVMAALIGEDFSLHKGAGAAGGLGFGLKAFCGGTFESGFDIFSRLSGLEQRIQNADLVITGEGAMDKQTLMGKGVGGVANLAARAGKRCLCLAGYVPPELVSMPWPNFQAYAIVPNIAPMEESKAHAGECLSRLAAHVARGIR